MRSVDSRAQSMTRSTEAGAGRATAGEGSRDLERWLCDPTAPLPSLDDLACAFGVSFDTADAFAGGADDALPSRLRLTLAVLRDAFPDDGAVRRWLRAPAAELDGDRPLDLLLRGCIDRLEELAIREWRRLPATTTLFHPLEG